MRIRYLLVNAYAVGGTVRTVVNQANAQAAAGHDVDIVSVFRHRDRPAFPPDPAVRLRCLVDQRRRRRYRPLTGPLERFPSRLVPRDETRFPHFSLGSDAAIAGYLVSRRGGIVVTTRPGLNLLSARFTPRGVVKLGQDHANLRSYKPAVTAQIARWYPRLDALTVLTKSDEKDYRQLLASSELRIEHIPNSRPQHNDGLRADLDAHIIVAAGRLSRVKGFDMLIDAFARLASQHPSWRLHIYGSGKQRHRLDRRIADAGLPDQVALMGRSATLGQQMCKASIYVLSSRREGAPMVLLEAMSLGLPVIAFDCHTGPQEMITHGHDGVLVPPNDVTALAAAMAGLMNDPARRRALAENGRQTVQRYDLDKITPQWTKLLEELMART
jgi:glycosyltransferase involved in cell wall biosynthesis